MTCDISIKRTSAVGLGKETTPGTAVAPTIFIPFETSNVKPMVEYVKDTSAYGIIDEVVDSKKVKEMSETTIAGNIRDNSIGELLSAALSDTSVLDQGDGTGKHTFNRQNDNCNNTYTIYDSNNTADKQAPYSMLDTLELEFANDYATYSAKFMGKSLITPAVDTPAAITSENLFLSAQSSVYFADTTALLDTAITEILSDLKLTITKNIEDYQGIGSDSLDVYSLHNKQLTVSGNFTALFRNEDHKNYVLNGVKKAMRIVIKSDKVIGTGSEVPTLTLECGSLSFEEWDSSTGNNDLIEETIGFVGTFDLTSGKTISAELINDKLTAY